MKAKLKSFPHNVLLILSSADEKVDMKYLFTKSEWERAARSADKRIKEYM